MRKALGRAAWWLDDRTGLGAALRSLGEAPVPGGARWWYALGAVLTFLLALELVTGVLLGFYYAPSAQTAWASVAYIQDQLAAGWFVRGLHSFGASAMVVVGALHFLQVVLFGAYKTPREANWLVGLALFGLVLLFALTGFGLPWDQKGYWAKLVETSILGSTPVVGPALERVVQGGSVYGNFTVTHLFAVHVFVLPVVTAGLVTVHLWLVRRHKVTPAWRPPGDGGVVPSEPYWPGQAFRDVTASALALAVVAWLVWREHGAALEGPADPTGDYQARPEWYSRPLYRLRLFFDGPLEAMGTMVIPGLVLGFLLALPWLDRSSSRAPGGRKLILGAISLVVGAIVGLGVISVRQDGRDAGYQRHRAEVAEEAQRARALAREGVLPEGGLAVFRNDPAFATAQLFKEECAQCHKLTGKGGGEGPDLRGYNSRDWIRRFLRDPQSPLFHGAAKKEGKGMKPVEGTEEDLAALTELVYRQTGAPDVDVALAKKAEPLFSEKNCDSCHEIDGSSEAKGPNLLGRGTPPYVEKVIAEAARPELFGERSKMPRFRGKLTPEQIAALAKLVIGQRESR